MSYIAGIETERVLPQLVAAGVDPMIAEELLAGCEQGFVLAKNEKEDDDGGQD